MGIRDLADYVSRVWFIRDWHLGWTWEFSWTGGSVNTWRYFKDEEVVGLDKELVSKLDSARHVSGVPFTITSGKRSPDENQQAGGVQDSAHETGLAVDLRVPDGTSRFLMVSALLQAGFKRMGVYDKHIHVDIDASKPQNVLWVGQSH